MAYPFSTDVRNIEHALVVLEEIYEDALRKSETDLTLMFERDGGIPGQRRPGDVHEGTAREEGGLAGHHARPARGAALAEVSVTECPGCGESSSGTVSAPRQVSF